MHICVESVWMHRRNICSGTQFYQICSIITTAHSITITSSFIEFTVVNKVWSSFSRINFQPLDGNCNIIASLHLSVYMHTSTKWRFYKNFIKILLCNLWSVWADYSQAGWVGKGRGSTHTQTRATQQLRRRVLRKVFYRIYDVIWT